MDNQTAAQHDLDIEQVLPAMPSRQEVERELAKRWQPKPAVERVSVDEALGRVLASDVIATYSCPPAQTSGLDGIGVHFAAFANGIPDTSGWVRGVDYEICDTGDDVPDAFDTVIRVEDLLFKDSDGKPFPGEKGAAPFDNGFSIAVAPKAQGEHVNAPGSNFKEGDVIVAAGTRLTPEALAAAVSAGAIALEVYARPRVAIIPTGDELVEPGAIPARGRVINSNAILLSSYVRLLGGDPHVYPIVLDRHDLIDAAVTQALATNDIVLVNAGSSKGSEDCGPHVLEEHAQVVIHHGQKAAPGRPAMSAITPDGKVMCVIPGPPLACDSAMRWLVFALVGIWYGIDPHRHSVYAHIDTDVAAAPFEVWRRCVITKDENGELNAHVLGRGSAAKTMGCANGILLTPRQGDIHAGDKAEVLLIDEGFAI